MWGMTGRHVRRLGLVLTLCAAAGVRAAPPLAVFSDGEFEPGRWSFLEVDPGDAGSVAFERQGGGNPGNMLRTQVVVVLCCFRAVDGLWFWHERFDPAASGGFAALEYHEDARRFADEGGFTGPAIRQAENVYTGPAIPILESDWTPKRSTALGPDRFRLRQGTVPIPDFSAAGAPIEVGFFRSAASSRSSVTAIAGIDNWSVAFLPPCTTPAECEDGDPCTTEACPAGICQSTPVVCDDGDACTTDACDTGVCPHDPIECEDGRRCTPAGRCVASFCEFPGADFELTKVSIDDLIGFITGPACGDERVVRRLGQRLARKLAKARARVARAGKAQAKPSVERLLRKADRLIVAARAVLDAAVANGHVSAPCNDVLQASLAQLRTCFDDLPRPP